MASAYVIKDDSLKLRIALVEINKLLLHEEVIPEFLEQLMASIKEDKCLNHPIIVDAKSRLVLDGVHRVAALEKLGCKTAPACLVDYSNPAIKVFNWYRTISRVNDSKRLVSIVKRVAELKQVSEIEEKVVGVPPVAAALKTESQDFLINYSFKSLSQAFNLIKCVEEQLRAAGLAVTYETASDALKRLEQRKVDAVLYTPRVNKQMIIDAARSGETFAYKATRHIIPARPMRLCVPLHLLKANRPLEELNEKLKSMLIMKKVKHLPPGSVFEGRRYEEDLYVFEE